MFDGRGSWLVTSILFIHNYPTSFVIQDRDLLAKRYSVRELYLKPLRQNLLSIYHAVQSTDLVFGWFASWHTFWPFLFARTLKKPSLLVSGGYDVANIPEIGYGHQRGGLKRWISRTTIRSADVLVTHSLCSQQEIVRNIGLIPQSVHIISPGIPDLFGKFPLVDKELIAISVGFIEADNLWRKGHEPFVRAASYLPHISFYLIGDWKDNSIEYLKSIAKRNVKFTGWIEISELVNFYRRASVYAQPSRHESFGIAVAESMLAGCIPVVTRLGSLPEVVGDSGLYVETQDPKQLAQAINIASNSSLDLRRNARERILDRFSVKTRIEKLYGLVDQLTNHLSSVTKNSI